MISSDTLEFLFELNRNNNKEWMDENRAWYKRSKDEFQNFAKSLLLDLAEIDPTLKKKIDSNLHFFRINRDIRFSKDKTPYKPYMGMYIGIGGWKGNTAGYYFHIKPKDRSILAAGHWAPDNEALKKIRNRIAKDYKDLEKILQKKSFQAYFPGLSQGDALKSAPKGFEKDHPAIEYIKLKRFGVDTNLDDSIVMSKDLRKELLKQFKEAKPFVDFINSVLV